MRTHRWLLVILIALSRVGIARANPQDYFAIHVVDAQTGRGIPLVILETTYKTRYVTDSDGYVAFLEPGLMNGEDVWFDVRSYGYESPVGAFGVSGIALKPAPGNAVEIKLKRDDIAERLYRMTGYGIYRDTVLLGRHPPIEQGLLNARVTGQDTVQTAIYRNKMYWFWQDTNRVGFALGCFSMTGATSALPADLHLNKGIDFNYFTEKPGGFARAMAIVPRAASNPIWVDGLTVVKDDTGRQHMIGRYFAANKDFSPAEAGLVVYNDDKEVFERLLTYPDEGTHTPGPSGHPIRIQDADQTYIFYPGYVRVKADFASASNPADYEGFTCLDDKGQVERDAGRKLVWTWRKGAEPTIGKTLDALIAAGRVRRDESPLRLIDIETKKPIRVAGGSIAWNPYLHRWTFLFGQSGGTSNLGEIWLATANSPEGPWHAARKIATHTMPENNNDLYNPIQHNELQQQDGKTVYFEGTFVNTFSGNPTPTPYYDYNNIMYRVDISDPRVALPEPPPGLTHETIAIP